MKKLLALILTGVTAMMCFAGCSKTADKVDLAYIKGNKKMVIGYTVYEPMNFMDESGKLVGFDTEFAEAVCEKLGVTPEFVEINWDTKETELKAKNIDCIWNGFTINEERKANITFSKPYIENKQVVVVKKSNTSKYKDTKALTDSTVVAENSSAGEDAIKDDDNLKNANYVAVQKQTDALLEVKSGTADAAVLDYTLAYSMVGDGTDYSDLEIVPGLDLAVEEYGIGFRKDSDTAAEVDSIIDTLLKDGTMQKLADKYDLSAILIK